VLITAAMDQLADLIRDGVDRPVTCDPTRVANAPCVLIEPPELDVRGTYCGTYQLRFRVLVIGLPGARAALDPLAQLVQQTLHVLENGPGWTTAEPVGYVPATDAGMAEPSQAYRITVEEYQ
jgi:hypothetical protein